MAKILLAMAQGVPIVSTTLGSDGFDFTDMEQCLIANTPIEFYQQVCFLLSNRAEAYEIANKAQTLFIEKYSQQYTADIRNKLYHKIVSNI